MKRNIFFPVILLFSVISANQAPLEKPIIDRENGWCENGSITQTTSECICSTHLGNFCTGKSASFRSILF